MAVARYVAPQSTPQSRIVVDIRSANLDKDYNVYIQQKPHREVDVASVWSGLQALGGLFITVLTIQKLWEDIRFIRLLRRELSSLVGSLTDAAGGADAKDSGDAPGGSRPTRPRANFGPAPGPLAPAARQLDLHLEELSDLLGGGRGAAAGKAADAAAAAEAEASTGAVGVAGAQQRQSTAEGVTGAACARRETTWASISGLMEVKILLQEATVLPTLRPDLFQGIRQPPKALLLFGPPGTGKTLLARAVATESQATFLPVTGSSVLSMWYGQSEQNVKALFEKARKRQPAIIFIDEVDSLLGKRSSGGRNDSTPDKRVTNEFLAFIDGIQTQQAGGSGSGDAGDTRVVVIAATNTPWDLDEAALSRFSRRVYVPLPDRTTREALMRKAMESISCDVSGEDWQRLAEQCDKYSGRDLVQVCREAAMRPLRELWGRRLLEGSQPSSDSGTSAGPAPQQAAAAQQKLVELVAKSLASSAGKGGPQPAVGSAGPAGSVGAAAGGARARARWPPRWRWRWGALGNNRYSQSKKQARRELERWKRRHGASWCDVDAIMQQAERLVEARRQGGAAGAGQNSSGTSGLAGGTGEEQQQQQRTDQGSNAQPHSAAASSDSDAAAAAVAADGESVAGAGGNAAAAAGRADGGAVRITIRIQDGCPATPAAADEAPIRLHMEVVREPEAAGSAPSDAATGQACSEAAEGRAKVPELGVAGSAAVASTAPSAATPAGPAAVVGGAAATSSAPGRSPSHRTVASSPSGGSRAHNNSREASKSAGEGAAAMSLENLLTLPADRVRPVTAADLEAALQIISCTEMDQSAKYTEWDEQYGSGAMEAGRRGGGRGRVWMSMYA